MKKFIVRRYMGSPAEMQEDMNALYEEGYYPRKIKLDDYQNHVDGTIIYELDGETNEKVVL